MVGFGGGGAGRDAAQLADGGAGGARLLEVHQRRAGRAVHAHRRGGAAPGHRAQHLPHATPRYSYATLATSTLFRHLPTLPVIRTAAVIVFFF